MPDYDELRQREARAQTADPTNDPEGRALVQAILTRKAQS